MKKTNPFRGKNPLRFGAGALTVFLLAVVSYGGFGYASGSVPYYAVSDNPSSMSPAIDYGYVVVTYKVPFSALQHGDIIIFHDPLASSLTIVHRIVRVIPDCSNSQSACLVTKGDNNATNPNPDPWNVTSQSYLGKVVLIVPYAGFLIPSMWTSEGLFAYLPVILIAAGIFVLTLLYDAHKAKVGNSPANRPASA